jgi:thiamin-phosphate kinase
MPVFKTGKIPTEVLVRNVFRYRGVRDKSVIMGSSVGEDAALVSLGKYTLVLTTDPVTGTASDIGWLAVNVNANDVACRGARPRWFLCDLLLPERSNVTLVNTIMKQVDRAAKQVGVAIVGGHTEVTPGLKRPIVIGYMMGVAQRNQFVTSNGAQFGDHIIMTKTVGIEGTAVLAADFGHRIRSKVGGGLLRRAKNLRFSISVVDDALTAVQAGGVRAMHDPTEGGLLQGVWELAEASGVGFRINESRISVLPETERICSVLRVNPLRLMSSGCLLIAADKRSSPSILRNLRKRRIHANIIGTITPKRMGRKLIDTRGIAREIEPSERDELYRVIESYPAK